MAPLSNSAVLNQFQMVLVLNSAVSKGTSQMVSVLKVPVFKTLALKKSRKLCVLNDTKPTSRNKSSVYAAGDHFQNKIFIN